MRESCLPNYIDGDLLYVVLTAPAQMYIQVDLNRNKQSLYKNKIIPCLWETLYSTGIWSKPLCKSVLFFVQCK